MLRALDARTSYNTRMLMDFQQVYVAAAWVGETAEDATGVPQERNVDGPKAKGAEGGGRGRPPSKEDLK
jgi:hypothetical protein